MKSRFRRSAPAIVTATLAGFLLAPHAARGDDIIMRNPPHHEGVTIEEATYEKVSFKIPNIAQRQEVNAGDVSRLLFAREPGTIRQGRGALEQGDYTGAIASLERAIGLQTKRWRANALYLNGLAHVRLAAQDRSQTGKAVAALRKYLDEFSGEKDFYVPSARILLAESLTLEGKYGEAERELQPLASGSLGNAHVVPGKMGLAEVKLAQEQFPEARRLYGELRRQREVEDDPEFRHAAELGYALSQLGQEQFDGAIKTVQERLLESDAGTPRLDHYLAQGYLVWGRAEEGLAGSDRDRLQWALIRYLHAASIAGENREDLAEALYRAREVSKKLGNSERARDLDQRLKKWCPQSAWARR